MTFVSNDPTFRATYGATVFVGGRYTGDLAASETLTLTRADGSTADTVTYGGAGWPQSPPPASRSSSPTRRRQQRSAPTGRSPPAPAEPRRRQPATVVITAPGAPTIGTATAGNANATVTLDRAQPATAARRSPATRCAWSTTPAAQVGALRPGRRRRHQPGRHRPDQRHGLPVPGRRRQQRRHQSALGPVQRRHAGQQPPCRVPRSSAPPARAPPAGTLTAIARWTPPTIDRRLGHHRLSGHRPADELRAQPTPPSCPPPSHPSWVPRSDARPSPSPPATTGSRSPPSTPSAPAHPRHDPTTSSPAENRARLSLISRMTAKRVPT